MAAVHRVLFGSKLIRVSHFPPAPSPTFETPTANLAKRTMSSGLLDTGENNLHLILHSELGTLGINRTLF